MHNFFFLLFVSLFVLSADDRVEIYASSMDSKDDIVEAKGGVSVVYRDYFLSADRAIYNRATGVLELFENIRVNQSGEYKLLGKYAKLNIQKKEKYFKPFYMSEIKSKVWMSANEGNVKNNDIDIDAGSISGCNPVDPLWKMEFSSSDYNSASKWVNLYNTWLYIGDIPIFYTPYFGYSLDTERRTGLIMPSIGYLGTEGVFYEQPIYIAEQDWWDLELKPQVRTNRGKGVYQTFRFVDSKNSHGELRTGYFKEFDGYFQKNNLQNDSHYGFEFKYDNSNFLNQWLNTSFEGQSGLYVDINRMNDVDYINLASKGTQNNSTATQVLSRVNMFYNVSNHYIGAYFKYYQDLTLTNNDDTLQKLPTVEYHYYLDTFLNDHVLYSFDIQTNNIERSINVKAVQTELNLPITIQMPLFNEYLNLSYNTIAYMQHSKFSGESVVPITGVEYNDGYFLRNNHTFSASTQLTKGYEDFSHVISFGMSYNRAGEEFKTGYYKDNYDICADIANRNLRQCEFYNISDIKDETSLEFTQYIYDSSAKQILYSRLAQNVSYSNNKDRFGALENELNYQITDNLNFYNNMFYNYEQGLFSKVFNQVSLHTKGLAVELSHLYKDTFQTDVPENIKITSYLTSNISYNYDKHYSYSGQYNYDVQNQELKNLEVGFLYKKRCWDFGMKYTENNRPILTRDGESSVYDRYIYITIVLKPLMKLDASPSLRYQLQNN